MYDKAPISQNTNTVQGWLKEPRKEHSSNLPYKLTRDQQQNPAALGDRKQVQQEGQAKLFPTMP